MAKQEFLQTDLDEILQVIKLFPEGASLEEIMKELKFRLHLRTLQRRLAFLMENGYLIAEGKTRLRRYRLPLREFTIERGATSLSLSSIAMSLQEQVCRPIHERQHVGYNRNFLDNYQPNIDFYLPGDTRKHLFEIGRSTNGTVKPAGTYARQIINRLLIDLSWNSSRLEGNTYSLLETQRLLEVGALAEGKDFQEAQMILNHKAAIEFLVTSANEVGFNRYTMLSLHALLADNLLSDQAACGRIRSIPVGIGKSVYHPPAIPHLVNERFDEILEKARAILDPIEQAFFVMVHIPYLQPFDDVNKRTSRLAANLPLIQKNLCPLSFIDVPEDVYIHGLLSIYELNRIELFREVFVWAYERSCRIYSDVCKTVGEPDLVRMRYRGLIREIITQVVSQGMNKAQAVARIHQRALEVVPPAEQARFIEVVEREIMGLHVGNIIRFGLHPLDYEKWIKTWE